MNELIELKELRIGNLLSYDNQIVHVTRLSLDIDDEYEDQIGFCKLGSVSNEIAGWNRSLVDKLATIPLTPEWLERCGFKKEEKDGRSVGIEKYYVFTNEPFVYNSIHGFWLHGRHMNVQPKYVHQLQNLYSVLTGEELKIKEG